MEGQKKLENWASARKMLVNEGFLIISEILRPPNTLSSNSTYELNIFCPSIFINMLYFKNIVIKKAGELGSGKKNIGWLKLNNIEIIAF
jgi:hypothetical protein